MITIKPLTLTLLTALLKGENYGYGLYMQAVADTQGALFIVEREVYRELPRLVAAGLVEKSDGKPVRYKLTRHGRRLLTQEKVRLQRLTRLLTERL